MVAPVEGSMLALMRALTATVALLRYRRHVIAHIAANTTARLVGAPRERHDDVEQQTETTNLQLSST